MSNKNHIIDEISNDLKIYKYKGEDSINYKARVIYSALSKWIKISTLDYDILVNEQEYIGQSRKHLSNRAKIFLENILDLFPEVRVWFYPEYMEDTPQSLIIDRLKYSGELVKSGFNTNLAIPTYEECIISNKTKVIRGMKNNELHMHTGLTQLEVSTDNYKVDMIELFEFYGVETLKAEFIWNMYLKNAHWRKRPDISCQVFNKYSKVSFSKSWSYDYKLNENDISIYKENHSDYGIIKKFNGEIYTSNFNRALVEEYEVRRFMYALKKEAGNSAIAYYKYLDSDNAVELNLKSALPNHENYILLSLGWPKNSIKDTNNLIFSVHVWDFIKHILDNLNIDTVEVE